MSRRQVLAAGAVLALGDRATADKDPLWRVHDTATSRDIAFEELAKRLAPADVVFVGEQHDDAETHRAEAALLAQLHGAWKNRLTLSLEMLERDGQTVLGEYLAGKIDEAAFARSISLWPNYKTDYRPLVEFAKKNNAPVLAANAPGRIVKSVGKEGLTALETLASADKAHVAGYVNAPHGDAYWERFKAVIGQGHGDGKPLDAAMVRRFYEAQCLRDDTMAETVVRALAAARKVVHVCGSFHSDAGLGTVARVLWRRPLGMRLAIVKIVPAKGNLAQAETKTLENEAHFLLFVPQRKPDAEENI